MKKISIIVLAILAFGQLKAQTVDTLFCGQRDPTYYYWDTNWFDHYALNITNNEPVYYRTDRHCFADGCQPEIARYCYTDTALRIIGVAGSLSLLPCRSVLYAYRDEDPWDYFVEEFFRLYEVDSTTDSMILLAQGEWTKTPRRHYIECGYEPQYPNRYIERVYEAYFNTPQIVHDSFYVSTTMWNNYYDGSGHPHVFVQIHGVELDQYDVYTIDPKYNDIRPHPIHFKRKLHKLGGANNDYVYHVTDTLWHVFHTNSNNIYPPKEFNEFLVLFPIIDTGWHNVPGYCPTPRELRAVYVDCDVAMLGWNGTPAHQWQLSVAPDGGTPEGGTIYNCTQDMQPLYGLDTAQWYTAWVRSICDNDSVSEWSDSIRFYVPSTGSGTIAVDQPIDAFTHLLPNPASHNVNVISSYRIDHIDIYAMNGTKVMTQEVQRNTISLDISALAAGSYLMRIYTSEGVANKRLIVK